MKQNNLNLLNKELQTILFCKLLGKYVYTQNALAYAGISPISKSYK